MDYMNSSGVYLDNNILRQLAENINKKFSDPYKTYSVTRFNKDSLPLKFIDIKPGYYNLEEVPGKYNWGVNVDNMLKYWYGR